MHYRTRLALCRLAFLLFCLLPTALVALWIAFPDTEAHWEAALSARTGLAAAVADVSHPRPGITVLSGVVLSDPETGLVARARHVEIARTRRGLTLVASQPQVPLGQLGRIHRLLHDRVLRCAGGRCPPVLLRADTVQLVRPGKSSEGASAIAGIDDLLCRIHRSASGSRMSLSFRPADQPLADKVELSVERKRTAGRSPTVRWFLKTQGTRLPCRWIASDVKGLARLGAACRFDGIVWAERSAEGYSGEVNGRFTGVDLFQLVGQPFRHTMRGAAQLQLKRARLRGGRLVNAAGSITSRDGWIGARLLEASADHLHLKYVGPAGAAAVRYKRLDLSFDIDGAALTIRGHCDHRGTILRGPSGHPLLVESSDPTVDVLALVRTLVPARAVQVPMTQETASLLSVFPVPSAAEGLPSSCRNNGERGPSGP